MGQQKSRSRKLVKVLLVVLLAALIIWAYSRPVPAIYAVSYKNTSSRTVDAALNWPVAGEAAVGALGWGVLATHGPQTELPTASTAKLITALTVLRKYPLKPGESGPIITLKASDVTLYDQYLAEGGSVAQVTLGEKITEYQMIEGMMLPSADNLADSLAIWAFGSLPAYRSAAAQFVSSLGLNSTQIGVDASGFSPTYKGTAHDLLIIGEAAMRNPVLAQIAAQSQTTLPVAGTVHNVNWLLGEDGIVGLKTGNSPAAGGVFIFASNYSVATNRSVVIVGVIQGQTSLQAAMNAAPALLNSTESGFKLTASPAGEVAGRYDVPWSAPVNAITRSGGLINWNGVPASATPSLRALRAPVQAGATAGSLSGSGGKLTVMLQKPIGSPPWWWRILRHKL